MKWTTISETKLFCLLANLSNIKRIHSTWWVILSLLHIPRINNIPVIEKIGVWKCCRSPHSKHNLKICLKCTQKNHDAILIRHFYGSSNRSIRPNKQIQERSGKYSHTKYIFHIKKYLLFPGLDLTTSWCKYHYVMP